MATVLEEMPSESAAFAAGESTQPVVAGHYEIDLEQPLGAGGMAVVYRGRDLRTRRVVALKTLRIEYRRDPETRARFRREARTQAFLAHPNVTRVYDVYEDEDAPWVILEYVPGRSLKEEIAANGPFSVEETAKLLDQMAKALDHLHARGLVHLDVKPQNLLVTPDRTVKLIDFGLAQPAGVPQEMIGGSAFGTAAYLSPEQACGEPVDYSTDVYSLGCVVYEMLTGQPPFGNDPDNQLKNDIIRAHLDDAPPPPSSVRPLAPWVDDAVLLALAKEPRERYRDCASFARVFWTGIDVPDGIVGPTVRLWSPPVVDTRVEEELEEPDPSPSRRRRSVSSAVYRTGGRVARHTGGVQRLLWRITAALLVANVMLAGMLWLDRGEIPGITAVSAGVQPGGEARVATSELRLRAEPGRGSAVLGVLELDTEVMVRERPVTVEGEQWWPVSVSIDGQLTTGYVSGEWLEPVGGPGDAWVRRAIDEVESWPGRLLDRIGATG